MKQFELSFPPHDPRHEELKKYKESPAKPPEVSREALAASREEIAYGWRSDVRDAMYTKLIGQSPKDNMTELQIADGILNPEAEKDRLWHENRDEDRDDTTGLYRRPKPGPTEQ